MMGHTLYIIFNVGGALGVLPFLTRKAVSIISAPNSGLAEKGTVSSAYVHLVSIKKWLLVFVFWIIQGLYHYIYFGASNVVGTDTLGKIRLNYLVTFAVIISGYSSTLFISQWNTMEQIFEEFNAIEHKIPSRKRFNRKIWLLTFIVICPTITFCVSMHFNYFLTFSAIEQVSSSLTVCKLLIGNEIQSVGIWLLIAIAQEKFEVVNEEFQSALSSGDFLYLTKLRQKYMKIRRYVTLIQKEFSGCIILSIIRLMFVFSVTVCTTYENHMSSFHYAVTITYSCSSCITYMAFFWIPDACENAAHEILATFDLNEPNTVHWRSQIAELRRSLEHNQCQITCLRAFPLNLSSLWKEIQFLITFMVILLQLSQTDSFTHSKTISSQ